MRAGLSITWAALVAIASIACGESPSAPSPGIQLDLIGPDTFWIDDAADVNPGCHYRWTIRAVGTPPTSAELVSGRILRTLDLASVPTDTMYVWTNETIQPLFGSPEFRPGQERESGPYASVSRDLPEMRMRVEFDYVVDPDGSQDVVTREFYCLRG